MASSSSFQSWNYDVFLSFRGTDTRKNFVDHLYSALVQQGIKTYKDDLTLDRGETIGPSLLKAIEESQIAVIILSENYADSSWCLDELAYVMKCKDERGQIFMPIFYQIDPSEVRKQKRKYGEAFARYDELAEKKKVESWRNALTDVGNLSGWETKHIANGHEAKCIKEIVDTISSKLCATISSDNEDLIGLRDRLQVLKTKMEMKSDGVVMVGIWGIGGGGKTTLASALYDDIFSKFDGCCFLDNIREESNKYDGLLKLQGRVLSLVLKQQMEVNRVVEGRRLIKSRLCRKKVLIVLDDVDHLDQLKALAGSHDWFGEGSRIIITTRDNHLLNVHNVNVMYNVCLLNEYEALQLFCKHAPRHDGWPIEDYQRLSEDVVSYANGLPLALIVLGSFLCDKDKSEWTSALDRLRDIPDIDIVEKLRISYDGLKPMEKELFLDIACFFRGEEKDEAMGILDACGYHPIIGVKVLIQKALITVTEKKRFDMHDMIQEMGHYIVRGENPKNPELHSRVWQNEDVVKICAMDATMENEMIEALQAPWYPGVPPSFPQVVAKMKKLRWISCRKYPATSISREFQPMKLCHLTLRCSLLEQLWEGYKGNAVKDYFISLCYFCIRDSLSEGEPETFTLQLPCNWYNEFSGFLIQSNNDFVSRTLIIKDVMDREKAVDVLEVFDEREEMETVSSSMCYISFGSLRHTSWWNSTHTTISFSLGISIDIKVELVPIRSKGDSIERAKHTTNTSEYWFEEPKHRETFKIKHDSKSCIEIEWNSFW